MTKGHKRTQEEIDRDNKLKALANNPVHKATSNLNRYVRNTGTGDWKWMDDIFREPTEFPSDFINYRSRSDFMSGYIVKPHNYNY